MTEYDYSPEAYNQFRRTQQRITNWADDTAHCAPQYKSPFAPRSDVQGNEFYNPRSGSSSRSHSRSHSNSPSPSGHHGRRTSQTHNTNVRSPLRSHTIQVPDAVSPDDSISQVSGRSHRTSSRRTRSHSPSHRTSTSKSHHSRSNHHSPATYVVRPAGGVQYGGVQYQPMQYVYQPQPQPAAYVVYPRDGRVQAVYPQPAATQYPPVQYATQEHHGGLLQRIFGSQSGKHERSRSVSVPRRSGSGSRR